MLKKWWSFDYFFFLASEALKIFWGPQKRPNFWILDLWVCLKKLGLEPDLYGKSVLYLLNTAYKVDFIMHKNWIKVNYFQVFCELPHGVATVGEAVEVKVDNCPDPHCFPYKIIYNPNEMNQIKNLIQRSSVCTQRITIQCLSAPLQVNT